MYDDTITVGDGIVPIPYQTTTTGTITLPYYQYQYNPTILPFEPEVLEDDLEEDEEETVFGATEFVRKIIFNGDATIVFWEDDTKTVVKWDGSGEWSEYTAFCAAFAIKMFGSNSHLKRVIKDNAEYHMKPKKPSKVAIENDVFLVGDLVEAHGHDKPCLITEAHYTENLYRLEDGHWCVGSSLRLVSRGNDDVGELEET